jgi:menaquinone-dependent protoporphyrinogen IX oxidase
MKGIIIYDTTYGNTRKIAEAISETLKESGMEIDTYYVKDVKHFSARDYDFLILGSPTRFGTMSFTLKSFISRVKSEEWMDRPFGAFDTEMSANIEKHESHAAEKIAEKLKDKQMIQLLPVLRAVVTDNMHCTLKEGEIERAKDFARNIAVEVRNIRTLVKSRA